MRSLSDPCDVALGMSDLVSDLTEPAPSEPAGDLWIGDGVHDEEMNGGDGVRRGGVGVLDLRLGRASCDLW